MIAAHEWFKSSTVHSSLIRFQFHFAFITFFIILFSFVSILFCAKTKPNSFQTIKKLYSPNHKKFTKNVKMIHSYIVALQKKINKFPLILFYAFVLRIGTSQEIKYIAVEMMTQNSCYSANAKLHDSFIESNFYILNACKIAYCT